MMTVKQIGKLNLKDKNAFYQHTFFADQDSVELATTRSLHCAPVLNQRSGLMALG